MRRRAPVALVVAAAAVAVGLIFAWKRHSPLRGLSAGSSHIDQAVILERLQSVANLVTTEVALRDVVTYRSTRLGSTKRALVVVTGKALVGFDLKQARARVDHAGKLIEITLPRAKLVSIDVVQLKTYDESRGLWNPFRPADRDTIYQLAREQLGAAARELEVREHAETGARSVLAALFASSGYAVRVEFEPFLGTETQ